MKTFSRVAAVTFALLGGAIYASAGINMGDLYLTAGDQRNIHVIRNGVLVNSWANHSGQLEYAVAVGSTVRTLAQSGSSGAEYTLDGTYTGVDYDFPGAVGSAYDGTTDLVNNYLVDFNNGTVVRTDTNWQNAETLFSLDGSTDWLGITFDSSDSTLWVSAWTTSTIAHYALDGTLLGSFQTGTVNMTCLALDSETGALWFGTQTDEGTFFAYSKNGDSIGATHVADLENQNTLGGEFSAVPEPATFAIFAAGILCAALRRRK